MSARTLRITMIVFAIIGLGLASYLTYVHYAGIKPACTAGESCTKVQTSIYSELAGVPVALIGLLGYITILGGKHAMLRRHGVFSGRAADFCVRTLLGTPSTPGRDDMVRSGAERFVEV